MPFVLKPAATLAFISVLSLGLEFLKSRCGHETVEHTLFFNSTDLFCL